jgi:hypothetical protein
MAEKGVRRYCFTLNNYTEQDIQQCKDFKCTYMIFGKEIAPTTGTPHLQGYFETKEAMTMSAVCKKIKRISLREAKGNADSNDDYCGKDGVDIYIFGTKKAQGKRTDLESVRERVRTGDLLMRDAVPETQNLQVIRHAEIVLKYHEVARNWKPHVSWYYGKAESGKTRTAVEELGENYYEAMSNLKWWEGYDAHENVLIDEFRCDQLSFAVFLKMIDRYKFKVECKGGSRQFLAKKIIFTSQKHPCEVFNVGEDPHQITRRFDVIRCFGKINEDNSADKFDEL